MSAHRGPEPQPPPLPAPEQVIRPRNIRGNMSGSWGHVSTRHCAAGTAQPHRSSEVKREIPNGHRNLDDYVDKMASV